jgi:hypothetical protein
MLADPSLDRGAIRMGTRVGADVLVDIDDAARDAG